MLDNAGSVLCDVLQLTCGDDAHMNKMLCVALTVLCDADAVLCNSWCYAILRNATRAAL
jgi:hypothetical protein